MNQASTIYHIPLDAAPARISRQEISRASRARRRQKDPEAFKQKLRHEYQTKNANNPIYCEKRRQHSRINYWLRSKGIRAKACNSFNFTPSELRQHLSSLWQPGMSWDNYGKRPDGWCIDHIKPVSDFVEAGITDNNIISALENLQPLWIRDNESKGRRPAPVTPTYSREPAEYAGEKHPNARLTEAQVKDIKQRIVTGKHGIISQLAREYNVAFNSIYQIKSGNTWKEVTP